MSVHPREVKIGGEIGRRIDVTVQNNLLKLKLEEDFLNPFRERKAKEGFTGLGMLLDATVRLAAYTGDPRVFDLKRQLVQEVLKTQGADGYIGMMAPGSRMWALWDIHEMGYLIYGLTADYQLFQERPSLDAARKLADYLLVRWTAEPQHEVGGEITTHMAVTGLERTLLTLAAVSGDRRYRDFCTGQRRLRELGPGHHPRPVGANRGPCLCLSGSCLGTTAVVPVRTGGPPVGDNSAGHGFPHPP